MLWIAIINEYIKIEKFMDFVFPYVDVESWRKLYNEYKSSTEAVENLLNCRYDSNVEFIRFIFRSVEKHLPFIDRIVLIVQDDEHVPYFVNRDKVKIVYHKDFIPNDILPIFSSNVIETCMPNIEGLSERFIYSNDDCIAMKPLTENDFFYKDTIRTDVGRRKFNINKTYDAFRNTSKNSNVIAGFDVNKTGYMFGVSHNMIGMYRDENKKFHDKHKDVLLKSLTRFRENNNYNQYMYSLNLMMTKGVNLEYPNYRTFGRLFNDDHNGVLLDMYNYHLVCFNDITDTQFIIDDFKKKDFLQVKSKYEI